MGRQGVRWTAAKDYPDYYPDRPGGMVGRSIEAEPFDTRRLGDWFASFRGRDSLPAPLKTDDVWLLSRAWSTPDGFVRGARFVLRTLFGLVRGKRLFGLGSALTASLMTALQRQGAEVLLNTPLTGLIVDEEGTVTGATLQRPDGSTIRVRALGDIDFGHAMLERDKTVPAVPNWLILDTRHRRRYLFNAFVQGTGKLREAGIVRSAATIEELAVALDMAPDRLRATVDRFNGFARTGVDEDFGRGRTIYDNYYGDPRVRPDPNLGPLERGPFTAVQLVPGDLGTKGGLLTDEDGRALDAGGDPITGVYAAGNTTASVMGRTYPGPGATIGPAVVFGYRAGRHAAARVLAATKGHL